MNGAVLQLFAACVGCLGYSLVNNMKGKQAFFVAIGGGITWGIYLLTAPYFDGYFIPTFLAALFVGGYGEIMARVHKAPATIFLTSAAIPLIPGRNLYYMVFGMVGQDYNMSYENGRAALIIAFAIVLGFMSITIISRYIYMFRESGQKNKKESV